MNLYLKGRFLPSGAPGVAEQLLFDRKLIDAGIVDGEGKGPRYADLCCKVCQPPRSLEDSPSSDSFLRKAAAKRAPNWG
jgi:hypothetical protein